MEEWPARRPGGESGQSTVEWSGLVLLVAVLFVGLVSAFANLPEAGFAHAVSTRMLCAASLSDACDHEVSLESAYGSELAARVRSVSPALYYGRDMLGLPVDYRTCRSPWCAEGTDTGLVTESNAGEPVTLFTRVVDCRSGSGASAPGVDCEGERAGNIYVQYWAYYPESASLRGVPILEREGYHPNDWESVQVRIAPDGEVDQRASSHSGYNHTRSAANWGSDMGWGFLSQTTEELGLRDRGGWGSGTGEYLIAGGSHAGNVEDGGMSRTSYPSHTPARSVRLVPLENVRGQGLSRAARFDPITPPWDKDVWRDGEAEGTG